MAAPSERREQSDKMAFLMHEEKRSDQKSKRRKDHLQNERLAFNPFQHEDPMFDYIQQKRVTEKEERVKQLQALLDSSSSSDSDSPTHRKDGKRKRKKEKKKHSSGSEHRKKSKKHKNSLKKGHSEHKDYLHKKIDSKHMKPKSKHRHKHSKHY